MPISGGAGLVYSNPDLADAIGSLPWVADGVEYSEREALGLIISAALRNETVARRLLDMPWIVDGVSEDAKTAVSRLVTIIREGEAADSAVRIMDMPFIQTIEQADVAALDSMSRIALRSPDALSDLLAHARFKDGITDIQALMVAILWPIEGGAWLIENKPDLADAIGALPWVADGVEDSERAALEAILTISSIPETAARLIEMPFLQTIEQADVITLGALINIAEENPDNLPDLLARPLFESGITDAQASRIAILAPFAGGARLIANKPDLAIAIGALAWVADGVEDSEREALALMLDAATRVETTARRLIEMPFLQTIEQADLIVLRALRNIAEENPDNIPNLLARPVFESGITDDQAAAIAMLSSSHYGAWVIGNRLDLAIAIGSLPWVADGVDDSEREALSHLLSISHIVEDLSASERLINWVSDSVDDSELEALSSLATIGYIVSDSWVERLINMPFLQTIEPADALALTFLERAVHVPPDMGPDRVLADILERPQFKDGITGDQAMIFAMLQPVFQHAPDRVDKLLDPNATTVERRTVELPLSGEVELAVVRTYLRTSGTLSSMDLLENAVREAEKLMDAPLPLSHNAVWLLFEDAMGSWGIGVNVNRNFMVIRPEYDLYADVIAHEVAHYYWHFNTWWIDEGMANLMEMVIESERTGSPVRARTALCEIAENIMSLEALASIPGEPAFSCNYSLGERLFLDLLQNLGKDAFWEGARKLYEASLLHADSNYQSARPAVGIEDVRQAFGPEAGAIISRWYGG